MKLQQLPARQGALWVRQGFLIFFKLPLAFAGLFASFLFMVLVLLTLPWVGSLLTLWIMPLISLGFMLATRQAMEHNSPSTPVVFIRPLQAPPPQRRALIQLGVAYAVSTLLIILLAEWVDGGTFTALQIALTSQQTTSTELDALLNDPRLLWGMLVRFGFTGLLSVPFWHAPALIHWDGQSWGKSMFFSWMACWRNKGAFTVYGLTWVGVVMLFTTLSSLTLSLLGLPKLVALATLPAALMFSTVFYASLYYTFTDCFSEEGPAHV